MGEDFSPGRLMSCSILLKGLESKANVGVESRETVQ